MLTKEGDFMSENELVMIAALCTIVCVLVYITYRILRNPFHYPYFIFSFDVTGKRKIEIEDYIDNFLRDEHNWHLVQNHQNKIQKWKEQTENYIQTCKIKKYRSQQYQSILDDNHAYHFKIIRKQTRYRQRNYIKTSYKVCVTDSEWTVTWQWISNRHKQLEKIGFEATLREYNSKSQRKLMTPSLRKAIMERDHYTCQLCGKYMPDEVGLHIDHIIPIAKDGKSVPSNLRVLCSKCNGKKGSR